MVVGRKIVVVAAATLLHFLGSNRAAAQVQPSSVYQPPSASQGTVKQGNDSYRASYQKDGYNAQWSTLLGNALYFYDIQRSGTLPADFRVSWRNNSVPDDGQDVGLNLSGGFFDAGNYIKATFPLCWVVTQMSWSALMHGAGYDGANQTPYLDETLRTALDWLLEASSKPDELVVMIGEDNFYWGGDQNIPLNLRPSYVISRSKPGTDVFGSCASALASASMLYSGMTLPINTTMNGTAASLTDADYAATLRDRAETLHELAQTSEPQQVYQKAVKGVSWAYPSTDYADELVLSSTFLAHLTGNETYATYAMEIYTKFRFPFSNGALNWDQHTPATPVLLGQLAIAHPEMNLSLSKYQQDSEVWFDNILNGSMYQTFTTEGGLFWFKGDSDPASLNPAMNMAWLMFSYAPFASTKAKGQSYRDYAQRQLDYALGKNPMNAVYPVGIHPNSPQNPQSALASGGTNPLRIDTVPEVEAHVLYSGLVGGPGYDDKYYDERGNYSQTEVALDSNSMLVAICAYNLAMRSESDDPVYVNVTQPRVILPYQPDGGNSGSGGGSSSNGLSPGAQAGIAIAVIVVVLGIAGLLFWKRKQVRNLIRRRRFSKY